jgi:hypothetical protein
MAKPINLKLSWVDCFCAANLGESMANGDEDAPPTPWWQAGHTAQHERPTFQGLVGHFVGHVVLGALGFICVAVPAILFSILAHYLHLVVDTLVFVAYILVSLYVTAVELIRYVRGIWRCATPKTRSI